MSVIYLVTGCGLYSVTHLIFFRSPLFSLKHKSVTNITSTASCDAKHDQGLDKHQCSASASIERMSIDGSDI